MNAAAILLLAEKGLSAHDIAQVAALLEQPRDRTAAERQARHREKVKAERDTVTRDVTRDDPSPLNPPLKVSPDPFKKSPPISPQPSGRGARLPTNFEAPAEWIQWAVAKRGWSKSEATDEAEQFARYWQAKAGKDAAKLDWFKTWQNWVINSRRKATATASGGWDGMP